MHLSLRRVAPRLFLAIALLSAAVAATTDTVYLSMTGKRYHRVSCRTIKYKPTPVERKAAEKRGFGPCGICRP